MLKAMITRVLGHKEMATPTEMPSSEAPASPHDPSGGERSFDLNIEKILEGWEPRHAIRELIANALDEEALTGTAAIQINRDGAGNYRIRDFGRGLRYEHLTQNENEEKLANANLVIGKFGVGLKDALATLNRRGVWVQIISRYGEIALKTAPKHGFEDVITLHATVSLPQDSTFVGTEIVLRGVEGAEVEAAKNFFLRFSQESMLDATPYGQILQRTAARRARIYVTGLLVAEEENFLFSYNISSLTAAMRKALNRERTNVGRTAYSERVKAILLASKSQTVASALASDLSDMERGEQHDEVNWTDVATHACQILNAQKKVVFVTPGELASSYDSVDRAKSEGYQIVTVPDNIRRATAGSTDIVGNTIRDLSTVQQEWAASFQFKFVGSEFLTPEERSIFDEWRRIAQIGGGLPPAFKELHISETMRPDYTGGAQALGLWESNTGRIIIKRSELASLARFAGTLLHELTHARTGFSDVSREFEHALTQLIGAVVAASYSGRLT
jgi:hypothetical protein